jgi:hypothetical protein
LNQHKNRNSLQGEITLQLKPADSKSTQVKVLDFSKFTAKNKIIDFSLKPEMPHLEQVGLDIRAKSARNTTS